MRKEYDLKKMKFSKNPYEEKLKKTITIRLDVDVIQYFKELSEKTHVPYQRLLNDYLRSCKEERIQPHTVWRKKVG